tara:strand:+ start:2930 stop:4645 length:1716 start_codon:yes stop_codon:yes gene_type:complete
MRKKKEINKNQRSFFFEDFLETNQRFKNKDNSKISEDRILILFFSFIFLILSFSVKIIFVSLQETSFNNNIKKHQNSVALRRDVVDRNGNLISRNIKSYHAAIRSSLIKDSKKLLINLKIIFPELDIKRVSENLKNKKQFYIKKRLTEHEKSKLWSLGEKGIIFEPFETRVYPNGNLFSHVMGQIDDDNYGISGVEQYFDKELRDTKKISDPLILSLDSNLQYIMKSQLENSLEVFKADGAAGLLMRANSGELLSLVSLPDYNINIRQDLSDKKFSNKITNDIFELGSIFKTFTTAIALEKKIVEPDTIINGIKRKVNCSIHEIKDIKKFPESLSVEDILIRSSNVGTLILAQKIGKNNYKNFIDEMRILDRSTIELTEIGTPLNFNWEKCRLETVSFGHGITTTPLQAASAYAAIINGGLLINPTILLNRKKSNKKRLISEETSIKVSKILRKVVTDEEGTASLADIFGYSVAGKTGTSQYYDDKNKNINTFISSFNVGNEKYVLLVLIDDPQIAENLIYDYRGTKIKGFRNEAGWNAVYIAGQIIKRIGPILAINNSELEKEYVAEKIN